MGANVLAIPGITDPHTLVCISRARTYEQFRRMVNDALAGICPFCKIDRTINKIIGEDDFWRVWPCNPPEKNTEHHFLLVPVRHVISTSELSDTEWITLLVWKRQLEKGYEFTSCGILIRDGDATLLAGTIQHLHVHLMVPDGHGRLESPIFKGAEADAESMARAIAFEKLRQKPPDQAIVEVLTTDEFALVTGRL